MTEIEIIDIPTIKPEVKLDQTTRHKLMDQIKEEAHVIVHCSCTATWDHYKIRIWKSTFLYAKNSYHRSKLVHAENITMYPKWSDVDRGKTLNFSLIFTALPSHCTQFDMIEEIPEPGGFVIRNIDRNKSDIYQLDLT